jgi:ABC-type nitrate/sulfonate/bicarbonate transport system substrate-binding protein
MTDANPSQKPGRIMWPVLLVLLIAVVVYLLTRPTAQRLEPLSRVTIALPTQINSAPLIVAFSQGLFQKAGIEAINQPFLLGKDALASVLDGKADLAVVADTPFMHAVLGGKDIAMLAGVSQSRRSLAIVARGDRGIMRVEDLRGKSVGITMGTNFPYFLDAMLSARNLPGNLVRRIDLNTDQVIDAFKQGRVDAAVVFQPYLARLEVEMGERMKVFHGPEVYAFRFLLVGKPSYIDSHPREIQRVLRAVSEAARFIRVDPSTARRAVGDVVKVEDAIMARLFDPDDYVITLDQAMLLALDDQTRWAMTNGLAPAGPLPNYLNFMRYRDLEVAIPGAVRVAR